MNSFIETWKRLCLHKGAIAGLIVIIILVLSAIFAESFTVYAPNKINPAHRLQAPSLDHPFGTDRLGRDIFTRLVYGARISLLVGFLAVVIGALAGGGAGIVSGYFGGKIDNVIMRFMDIMMSIPQLVLAIAIVGIMGPGLVNLMISVGISVSPRYARLARASALSLRDVEFVEAARASGCGHFTIILRNILPNCMPPLLVFSTLGVAQAILSASSLSFLGLGIQPPSSEWGAMLASGREFMRVAPHLMIFPGLCIMAIVLSLNMLGDGLRDALDPKLRT